MSIVQQDLIILVSTELLLQCPAAVACPSHHHSHHLVHQQATALPCPVCPAHLLSCHHRVDFRAFLRREWVIRVVLALQGVVDLLERLDHLGLAATVDEEGTQKKVSFVR